MNKNFFYCPVFLVDVVASILAYYEKNYFVQQVYDIGFRFIIIDESYFPGIIFYDLSRILLSFDIDVDYSELYKL